MYKNSQVVALWNCLQKNAWKFDLENVVTGLCWMSFIGSDNLILIDKTIQTKEKALKII